MRRLFTIPDSKPPISEFPVELNLAAYLGSEEIDSVSYSATNMSTQINAGTSILDTSKSSNGTSLVKPWIRGGTPGDTYKVLVDITLSATGAPRDRFGIIVRVDNL